jgi:hypothetical protein
MQLSIYIPVVAALSALLGVLVTAHVQLRTQRSNQDFQLQNEWQRHAQERLDKEHAVQHDLFGVAHEILSAIEREFSITVLDIYWRANMPGAQYDQRYLEVCKDVDRLRRIVAFHAPSLSEDADSLYGQMNLFWGSFKQVLYLTERGEKVDHRSISLINAHEASSKVGNRAGSLKYRLADLVRNAKND